LRRYYDFLDVNVDGHPYRGAYFVLTALFRSGVLNEQQNIYVGSDSGSNDFKNNSYLFSLSHFAFETRLNIKQIFFLGPRHGYLDNDRHFGRAKVDMENYVQESVHKKKNVSWDMELLCSFLNNMKNTCATICTRYALPKIDVTRKIDGLKKYLVFEPSSKVGEFQAKIFPNSEKVVIVSVQGKIALEGPTMNKKQPRSGRDDEYDPAKEKKKKKLKKKIFFLFSLLRTELDRHLR
jgi:Zn-finger nucleic acid-binding protein